MSALETPRRPVKTSLFELFKCGPGPSSSHTVAPMRAGADFAALCASLPEEVRVRARRVEVRLFGSLSATGSGHGTPAAVLAGLIGHEPADCPPGLLQRLQAAPEREYPLKCPGASVSVSMKDILYDAVHHDFPHGNTLCATLLDAGGVILAAREYYSPGGGFIRRKGEVEAERGRPAHPYSDMRELRECLRATGLTLHELILENESAVTGCSRPDIFSKLDAVMEADLRRKACCPALRESPARQKRF